MFSESCSLENGWCIQVLPLTLFERAATTSFALVSPLNFDILAAEQNYSKELEDE